MSSNPANLAEYFSDIICGNFNQACSVRFVGTSGSGKSMSALSLAEGVAEEVAKRKGGCAEDYFCFEKDLAVMSTEKVEEVLSNAGKYHIIMADDLGTAVSARDFAKSANKDLSKVIQSWRPNNNLFITTTISGFLVDKIFRLLANYEIEMESSNHKYNYNVAKVQKIDYKHKQEKTYYPYIFIDGKKYVRHIFQLPSENIVAKYNAEREKQLKILMTKQQEEIKPEKKLTLKEIVPPLYMDWKKGVFGELSWKNICIAHNINIDSANVLLSRLNLAT